VATKTAKVSDLTPDISNANRGTERGRYALEASLRKYGAGRSILLDKNGRIIAGNKTAETAADVGIDDVIVVQTDGTQLVAVQRTDLDLDSKEGRELAYADNRVGALDLDFDPEQILADLQAGVDLSGLWFEHELDALVNGIGGEVVDPAQEWQGMPEFENTPKAHRTLYVHFETPGDVEQFSRIIGQSLTDKTKSIWFPEKQTGDSSSKVFLHES